MKHKKLLALLLVLLFCMTACAEMPTAEGTAPQAEQTAAPTAEISELPAFADVPYCILDDNVPRFTEEECASEPFESYQTLDHLGRCGVAFACVGRALMPTEDRTSISHIKPSGWVNAEYDCVDGSYLYNRCHLIGFQLTGENDNEKNLITGTRYLNIEGMLPFENMVADYVKETNGRVLYRVTPHYVGDELVARGVEIEALSLGDDDICFHVYCYNVQPGVTIDYATGESREAGSTPTATSEPTAAQSVTYVLNVKSKKFHLPSCSGVKSMNEKNREEYSGTRAELLERGYEPCGRCNP